MKTIKNRNGFTVVELLLAGSIVAFVTLALSSGVIAFHKRMRGSAQRAEGQFMLASLALQISRIGMLSKGCTKSTGVTTALQCLVDFTPGTTQIVRFEYNPDTRIFTTTRDGKVFQQIGLSDFRVCTGGEIKNGTCRDTVNTGWDGVALQNISLSDYYRFRVAVEYDSIDDAKNRSTAQSTKTLRQLFLDSGFYARNTSGAPIEFLWSSWSGRRF